MDDKTKILDIAMNLNRVGNWAADDYEGRKKRIKIFLKNTSDYLRRVDGRSFPPRLADVYERFLTEYPDLEKAGCQGPKDPIAWAESMMTWGNILTHRASLLAS